MPILTSNNMCINIYFIKYELYQQNCNLQFSLHHSYLRQDFEMIYILQHQRNESLFCENSDKMTTQTEYVAPRADNCYNSVSNRCLLTKQYMTNLYRLEKTCLHDLQALVLI